MRIELARALQDRVELHRDMNTLAERLSIQEDKTLSAEERQKEIALKAKEELGVTTETIKRQAAHIARLKRQTARPLRLIAKKFMRRPSKQSGSKSVD